MRMWGAICHAVISGWPREICLYSLQPRGIELQEFDMGPWCAGGCSAYIRVAATVSLSRSTKWISLRNILTSQQIVLSLRNEGVIGP